MTLEEKIAKAFGLKGDSWMKHANPWSVWTRFMSLPFIILAVWSRLWIGWYCLIPILLLAVWIKINPTLFKKPKSFDNWGSKAVLGEKYWSERKKRPVPKHHRTPVLILTILQIIGAIVLIFGLWKLKIDWTITGTIIVYFAKMWFLDRMVWVFEDMAKNTE
ncbi:hypothetical protein J8L85_12845 [Maribacter sp. MMG018]|uniref:DUF6653 family protein n=1 Tax=Maribacter sp. MMG018 TaxID=2822688 RepID=UPI001B369B0F|nr:DUF6653 family protein [Maribacter sp. MMG018]MBQ4915333.1 hypothetical protein [Maribacter sp. MMG018]